jgi:hypothetical protein
MTSFEMPKFRIPEVEKVVSQTRMGSGRRQMNADYGAFRSLLVAIQSVFPVDVLGRSAVLERMFSMGGSKTFSGGGASECLVMWR